MILGEACDLEAEAWEIRPHLRLVTCIVKSKMHHTGNQTKKHWDTRAGLDQGAGEGEIKNNNITFRGLQLGTKKITYTSADKLERIGFMQRPGN